MPHIFILIRSLNLGGAERQVSVLAEALHAQGRKVTIGVFYSGGILEHQLRAKGINILSLQKKGRWDLIGWFWRYLKTLQQLQPNVIYSFLTTSNIVATIGRLFTNIPVVWGIRASVVNLEHYDWLARLTAWVEKKISIFASTIIFNAHYSREYHQRLGYSLNQAIVIPNGIDTTVFKPNPKAGEKLRLKLGIPKEALVIGMVARFDPMKDYATFLSAARTISKKHPNLYFITAGTGTDTAPWTQLPKNLLRLGDYEDMASLYNALNIMVLCSFGEGFPNVLGEAMACGIPTISTDVGDAIQILGDYGMIIPPQNPKALEKAIFDLIANPPPAAKIREHIQVHFSVDKMAERTLQTLRQACSLP